MLGYSSNELVNQKSASIFHDMTEIEQRANEFSQELGEDIKIGFDTLFVKSRLGLDNTYEWKYITKDKKTIIVNLSISALKNNSDEIIGYMGIAKDISQKKRDEKVIRDYVELVDKNIITSRVSYEKN